MRHWITSFHQVEAIGWAWISQRARLDFTQSARHLTGMDPIETIAAPWRDVLLLCGKCSRKLGGGFGKKNKHDLKDVLRGALKEAGQRRAVRVLEVGCLGLCPKRAVSVLSTARPGEVLVIPHGADPAAVLNATMLSVAGASAP